MSLTASLSLCIIAGLLWAGTGVAYSFAARRGIDPAAMLFAVSGCASAIVLPWCRMHSPDGLILWMALSGVANWAGLVAMQVAMARGRAGLAWAMGQSAPLWPLVVAILAHGERPSLTAWCGLAAMATAVATLAHQSRGSHQGWQSTKWALAAFAIIGLQQSAMAEPSHRGLTDPGNLRLPVFYLTMFVVSGVACAMTRTPVRAAAWRIGAAAAITSLLGQWVLLRSLDLLAPHRRAGLAYPIAVGTCILAFALWRAAAGERYRAGIWTALATLLTGLALLAFGSL